MSYYLGFRFGWVRVGGHVVGWHDSAYHLSMRGRRVWRSWKVWVA